MTTSWADYLLKIDDHVNSNHAKIRPDDSCRQCYPVDQSKVTQEFQNFINWFTSTISDVYHYTSKTVDNFRIAKSPTQTSKLSVWLFRILTSLRYKTETDLDFNSLLEALEGKWDETGGFKDMGDDWNVENEYNNDYYDTLHINDDSSISGHGKSGEEEKLEEEAEEELETDKDALMVKALQQMMKELKRNGKKSNTKHKKESRLVDFPTFSGGDQDPIHWLEAFERASIANNVTKERMLPIVASYLKGTALTWYNKAEITEWNDPLRPERSFKH